jgi:hypothetical protein
MVGQVGPVIAANTFSIYALQVVPIIYIAAIYLRPVWKTEPATIKPIVISSTLKRLLLAVFISILL